MCEWDCKCAWMLCFYSSLNYPQVNVDLGYCVHFSVVFVARYPWPPCRVVWVPFLFTWHQHKRGQVLVWSLQLRAPPNVNHFFTVDWVPFTWHHQGWLGVLRGEGSLAVGWRLWSCVRWWKARVWKRGRNQCFSVEEIHGYLGKEREKDRSRCVDVKEMLGYLVGGRSKRDLNAFSYVPPTLWVQIFNGGRPQSSSLMYRGV